MTETIEIINLNWLLGVIIPAGLTWSIAVLWLLRDIKRGTEKLIQMHEVPDDHGFGTVELAKDLRNHIVQEDQVFANMTKALHDLVHYVRWAAQQQVGKAPPPPGPHLK